MTMQEKEEYISGLGAPWADLAERAKAYCNESIARIPRTQLSAVPEWDEEFKLGVRRSFEDGYDGFLLKIIELAKRHPG